MEFGDFTQSDNVDVTPEYNFTNVTCANTYCHGAFKFGDIEGNNRTVTWNSTTGKGAECGTCHGKMLNGELTPLPVGHFGSYLIADCGNCHSSIVNSDGEIIDKFKHINKQIDF